jgi:hypothetical protein
MRQTKLNNEENVAYHACTRLLGDAHLVEHFVALLHEQGALVGVGRDVRVVHLHHLHVCVDPGKLVCGQPHCKNNWNAVSYMALKNTSIFENSSF